ncbi:ABC transporter ATP-binding protein [Nitrosophilus alvini]|uniref:ABC transporter ATP-binding protein n=1 Tax=Nitrosophilus alvini TaxID=2714855 RepID=UPI00190B63EA|nr:ABC transporter ATP-binding protein [Nitrosophilus alvini]
MSLLISSDVKKERNMNENIIELENITKIYNKGTNREVVALKNIDLGIKMNETVILKGPSGSGKSTLLSIIAALTKPTVGLVKVKGEFISKIPDSFAALFRRKHIGFIFQKFNLLEDMSVFDNVVLPLIPDTIGAKALEEKALQVMEKFSIVHKQNEPVKNLSGGEQQRCAIARAMINSPEIILADEPTANLDTKLSNEFIDIIKELKNEGKTIVIATHDPRFEGLEFIDRIVEIKEGRIV